MAIVQQGSINTTALVVPDLYVQIVTPQVLVLNGVPTNIIGAVGTASWGPVNQATIISNAATYVQTFGAVQTRAYDLGTNVFTAIQQGANNFRCVRVTDGTDVAATVVVLTNCITFTSKYTGSYGNTTTITLSAGSAVGTTKVTVTMPGIVPEVYDNMSGAGNALWVNIASAINSGNHVLRGPSKLISASAGAGVTAPTLTTYTLASGTDGVTTITPSTLIGVDTGSRSGMYVLRNQQVSVAMLSANPADTTTMYASWTTQNAFGLSEGIYMILTGPSNDTVSNAVTQKTSAGLDSYACKLSFGDWLYWTDSSNNVLRLVSPQGFHAGRLANLSPEQSPLNKQIYGVVGSQKSGLPGTAVFQTYSAADMGALFSAGIDLISNPQPGGAYWGVRLGHNTSSNAATNGDNYTRLTHYIAATINAGLGIYIGQLINASLFRRVKATLNSFFNNMYSQGLLGTLDGTLPFQVICDLTNNPFSRTSLSYLQADCQVQYQAVTEKFIANVEGGQTVSIQKITTPTGQVG